MVGMALRLAICALLTLIPAERLPGAVEDRPAATMPLAVTDSHGRSVRDLVAADLDIREGGQPKKISSVDFRGAAPRQLAVFLDDYHVSAGPNTERARALALHLVGTQARPGDSVTVMRPLDSQQAIEPVDSVDRARREILDFSGRKGNFTPLGPFEAEYMSAAPEAVARERAQIVRSALQALAITMREPLDAPKALVILTEGFHSEERSRTRMTTMRTIARVARMANVPVYVVDPSGGAVPSSFGDVWRTLVSQTGGAILDAGPDPAASLARIASDLDARYVIRFEPGGAEDGGFHGLDVRVSRAGASVRAPTGYWASFAPSRIALSPPSSFAHLLTPHVSGLIQPWFRMAPAADGRTRVTFLWTPGASGRARSVALTALTFEGRQLHAGTVHSVRAAPKGAMVQTTFDAPPGPLQMSMAITGAASTVLDTDVRYIDVPRLDAAKPVITGVELIRPRSLPEFVALRDDAGAPPTAVRDFMRQDRLLVRVRAYAGLNAAQVDVRLLNRSGHVLLDLAALPHVDGAAQFDLPLARFTRGEYRLEVRARFEGGQVSQLIPVRLIG